MSDPRTRSAHPFRFGVVAGSNGQGTAGRSWAEEARHIEQLGFSTLLVPDRLIWLMAPLPALAFAAAATSRLRVGTFVLVNDFRNPVVLAREAATLDLLSGGRFELGIGAGLGPGDYGFAGIPFGRPGARIERLEEAVQILDRLLRGEALSYTGRYYQLAEAKPDPKPAQQPRPPILLGGSGKRLLSLAGRLADSISIGTGSDDPSEESLAERVGWIEEAAGDRFAELELGLNLAAIVGPDGPLPASAARVRRFLGWDIDDLIQHRSPLVLAGTLDDMCEQLIGIRERLGLSYITLGNDAAELAAPLIERLRGR
ncbi:MAG TPA: TIGR03621 family F420-dependent LLM class oxidoreductase [Thermomicrobiaceae bacterium]|nr:TIGR03621 family F420-dependent LLM class oxidoreductase [Thermomicrobiaceae bacterium]